MNLTIVLRSVCVGMLASMFASPVAAAEEIKTACHGLEARVINASGMRSGDEANLPADIKVTSVDAPGRITAVPSKTLRVLLFGPVLGSMDSNDFPTGLTCTDSGIIITMTIEHWGDAATKNILWRPRVELELILHQTKVVLEGKWVMRSRTGALVAKASGWGGPEEKFPLTIERRFTPQKVSEPQS
jgi:hypothetical protein